MRLRDISIRHKLLAIIVLTSGIALLLACCAFATYDWLSTRDSLVRRLTTMADVVGLNSTAALVFDSPTDARETLAALRAEPHIVAAAVFDRTGAPFALYHRQGLPFQPEAPGPAGHRFEEGHLEVVRHILLDGERVGSIHVRCDLSELDERLGRYGQIALVFLGAAVLVTLLIGYRLRAVISEPILRLLRAMQRVGEDQSYAVRAEKLGDDELGRLIDGFNAMLALVEQRDEALRMSLSEKEVLLQEVHHRVKNNLQIVASLLDLQTRNVADAGTREMLRDSRDRIRSMGLVHEHLYGAADLARIDLPEYVTDLCRNLSASYGADARGVRVAAQVEDISFDIDTAIPCGLIINELVSNALKYAFPQGGPGAVSVRLIDRGEEGFELMVADNGVGLPAGVDPRNSSTLGLQLVSALLRQIHGTLDFEREGGTAVRIRFRGHGGRS